MSFDLPGEVNPFEAPRAEIGEEALYLDLADHDSELIRREHLSREHSIRTLGRVAYLAAGFASFFTIVIGLTASGAIEMPPNQNNGMDPALQKVFIAAAALVYLVGALIFSGLGYGLTHLQTWARWTTVVLATLALVYIAFMSLVISYMASPALGVVVGVIGGGLLGLIIVLLATGKSGMVFSGEYREIIRKTPHICQRTSLIVKILLVILAAFLSLGVLSSIFGNR